MTPDPQVAAPDGALARRLRRLERVVWLQAAGLLLCFALAATTALRTRGVTGSTVRLRHLIIEDANGVSRGYFGVHPEGGEPLLCLCTADLSNRLDLQCDDRGAILTVHKGSVPLVKLGASTVHGAMLQLRGLHGSLLECRAAPSGASTLGMWRAENEMHPSISLLSQEDGRPVAVFQDGTPDSQRLVAGFWFPDQRPLGWRVLAAGEVLRPQR